jgi:Raf kinase inhibitor-like YbhB/YbcL family protein
MVAALTAAAFALSSPAFAAGHAIPQRYTCDGAGVSPPLRWNAPPRRTKAFALFVIDIDAGPFTHWTLWDLPATRRALTAGTRWPLQGRNSFGRVGYGGPCPPAGRHRYVFSVYALRRKLGLPRGAATPQFTHALPGRVVATSTVTGTYRR